VVVNAAARTRDTVTTAASLDLASGTWSELDPLPQPISVGDVSTGDGRVIVAGTRQDPDNNIIGATHPVVFDYTIAGQWVEQPAPPIRGQAASVAPTTGGGLLAWNHDLQAASYDAATGEWRSVADVPMPPAECYPHSTPTRDGVVAQCGGLAWFDATNSRWTTISSPTEARITSATETLRIRNLFSRAIARFLV
jgi:hypothetical protein